MKRNPLAKTTTPKVPGGRDTSDNNGISNLEVIKRFASIIHDVEHLQVEVGGYFVTEKISEAFAKDFGEVRKITKNLRVATVHAFALAYRDLLIEIERELNSESDEHSYDEVCAHTSQRLEGLINNYFSLANLHDLQVAARDILLSRIDDIVAHVGIGAATHTRALYRSMH
ncbi:MAG: hypothetical protein HY055_09775 [Magnetospirillum sp.]|nr:hypothetical protein [Magnetospirillum sp.]